MKHADIINRIWPEWQIEDKPLGHGSYGNVYKATRRDYDIESTSAIKVISVPKNDEELHSLKAEGYSDSEIDEYLKGVVSDFVNEIKMMESLKGARNIVNVEDYWVVKKENEPGWYIIIRMELLTPLNEHLENHPITEREAAKIGVDICTALEQCSKWNIIHRDIKPGNIFINRFGDYKLGDFGIARSLDNIANGLSKRYTPSYMAPEIESGSTYDARVDIYALGIVLYRLLNNNRLPFCESESTVMSNDVQKANARRLSGEALPKPCNASHKMASIILCACSHDPNSRFSGATAMKRALQNMIDAGDNTGVPAAGEYTVSVRPSNRSDLTRPDPKAVSAVNGSNKKSKLFLFLSAVLPLLVLVAVAALLIPKLLNSSVSGGEKQASNGDETQSPKATNAAELNTPSLTLSPTSGVLQTPNPTNQFANPSPAAENDRVLAIVAEANSIAATGDYHSALSRIQSALVIYPSSELLKAKEAEYKAIVASLPTQNPATFIPTQMPQVTNAPMQTYAPSLVTQIQDYECHGIDVGHEHLLALKNDGTVLAAGSNSDGQCNVSGWRDIKEVAAGYTFSAGLKRDGTVVIAGKDSFGKIDHAAVSQWRNIKHISAHGCGLIAVDIYGKVFFTGCNSENGEAYSTSANARQNKNAIAVAAGNEHLLILYSDGTCGAIGDSNSAMCNVQSWNNVVAIAAGAGGSIGLLSNGDVLYTGINNYNQYSYTNLHNIAAIASKGWHMMYITSSGYVGAMGWTDSNRCNTSAWNNLSGKRVIGIAASGWNNMVLFDDGTVALGGKERMLNSVNVSSWRGIVKTR